VSEQTEQGPQGRVMIIAGSDSGGGAGIQADIKAITALGGYAMTAITALTIQNTTGVFDVHPVPEKFIAGQISKTVSDLGVDAWKTGMLGGRDTLETVAEALHEHGGGHPIVVDPVMFAKGGHALLALDAIDAMKSLMVPLASLLTPNAPEAERLSGTEVESLTGQRRAAERLLRAGARAVLVKGAHVSGARFTDVLATHDVELFFEADRIDTTSTHGTGCTLASAIAALLAQGYALEEAVECGRAYVREAILAAPGFGKGHGPLNHAWAVPKRDVAAT
jgi:hydroxymethylpyrimidine/phosphomethylpyrimidine kinase